MNDQPCAHCGQRFHAPYEDGLVECIRNLEEQRDDAREALGAYHDAETILAAVVHAAGGVVELSDRALVDSFGLTLEMADNPGGGRIYRARKRPTSPLPSEPK